MAGSQQRASGQSSGGKSVDDHAFWGGGPSADSVLAKGAKSKSVSSCEGGGSLTKYEDTNERIVETQNDGVKKIKSHQGRLPEWRN
jgi:hypothetical protein